MLLRNFRRKSNSSTRSSKKISLFRISRISQKIWETQFNFWKLTLLSMSLVKLSFHIEIPSEESSVYKHDFKLKQGGVTRVVNIEDKAEILNLRELRNSVLGQEQDQSAIQFEMVGNLKSGDLDKKVLLSEELPVIHAPASIEHSYD